MNWTERNRTNLGKFLVTIGALFLLSTFFGCNGDTITGGDSLINEGEGTINYCCDEEELCPHPVVEQSCATSVGKDPTGCHGGVEPLEELPENIPCD